MSRTGPGRRRKNRREWKGGTMILGRLLITVALVSTVVGPVAADWNRTHIFNPEWPPHARFHGVVGLCLSVAFSLVGLWLLWRPSPERDLHTLVAALVPVVGWGSFFLALQVPGASFED